MAVPIVLIPVNGSSRGTLGMRQRAVRTTDIVGEKNPIMNFAASLYKNIQPFIIDIKQIALLFPYECRPAYCFDPVDAMRQKMAGMSAVHRVNHTIHELL